MRCVGSRLSKPIDESHPGLVRVRILRQNAEQSGREEAESPNSFGIYVTAPRSRRSVRCAFVALGDLLYQPGMNRDIQIETLQIGQRICVSQESQSRRTLLTFTWSRVFAFRSLTSTSAPLYGHRLFNGVQRPYISPTPNHTVTRVREDQAESPSTSFCHGEKSSAQCLAEFQNRIGPK